ncbi:helix-turn-helix transcriptional regulator [Thermovibrio sp.]
MEEVRVSCLLKNQFIQSLLKEKLENLGGEVKYLSFWENADVVIVDDGILLEEVEKAQKLVESGKVMVLLDYEMSEEEISVFLKLFPVKGVIYKDMDIKLLKKMLLTVKIGEIWIKRSTFNYLLKNSLTFRNFSLKELKIIHYLLKGYTNKEIAKELNLTEQSIKYHINQILKKTKAENRTQLIIRFIKFKKLIDAIVSQGELMACLNG